VNPGKQILRTQTLALEMTRSIGVTGQLLRPMPETGKLERGKSLQRRIPLIADKGLGTVVEASTKHRHAQPVRQLAMFEAVSAAAPRKAVPGGNGPHHEAGRAGYASVYSRTAGAAASGAVLVV
jgi:hypothetical protein